MKVKHIIVPLVIGVIASLADAWLFSNLWATLDWRRPIAEWLAGLGGTTLAGWFGQFWIRIPTFAVAAIVGVVVARLFADRWISAACFSALGFVGTSFLLMAWVAVSSFGWSLALKAEAWSVVSILPLLFGAWLYARRYSHTTGVSPTH